MQAAHDVAEQVAESSWEPLQRWLAIVWVPSLADDVGQLAPPRSTPYRKSTWAQEAEEMALHLRVPHAVAALLVHLWPAGHLVLSGAPASL